MVTRVFSDDLRHAPRQPQQLTLFALDRAAVKRLGLPHWALGTASFSLELARENHEEKHPGWIEALKKVEVPCLSWATLAERYGLGLPETAAAGDSIAGSRSTTRSKQRWKKRADVVKIDAEGLDLDIVEEIIHWHEEKRLGRDRWPRQIRFETWKREGERYDGVMAKLTAHGYRCEAKEMDQDCVMQEEEG